MCILRLYQENFNPCPYCTSLCEFSVFRMRLHPPLQSNVSRLACKFCPQPNPSICEPKRLGLFPDDAAQEEGDAAHGRALPHHHQHLCPQFPGQPPVSPLQRLKNLVPLRSSQLILTLSHPPFVSYPPPPWLVFLGSSFWLWSHVPHSFCPVKIVPFAENFYS